MHVNQSSSTTSPYQKALKASNKNNQLCSDKVDNKSLNLFTGLPTEILDKIVSYLDYQDTFRFRTVAKHIREHSLKRCFLEKKRNCHRVISPTLIRPFLNEIIAYPGFPIYFKQYAIHLMNDLNFRRVTDHHTSFVSYHYEILLNNSKAFKPETVFKIPSFISGKAQSTSDTPVFASQIVALISGNRSISVIKMINNKWNFKDALIINEPSKVNSIALSHDGRWLAIASNDGLFIRDGDNEFKPAFSFNTGRCRFVEMDHKGKWLACALYNNDSKPFLKLFKVSDKVWRENQALELADSGNVTCVKFSLNDRFIGVSLADTSSFASVYRLDNSNNNFECIKTIEHKDWVIRAGVEFIQFSPDNNYVATGGRDNTLRVCNLQNGEISRILHHERWVRHISFSPNGATLVSACNDGHVRFWDQKVWKNSDSGSTGSVELYDDSAPSESNRINAYNPIKARFSSSSSSHNINRAEYSCWLNLIVSCAKDGTVRVIQAGDKKKVKVHEINNSGPVLSVALSPDGKYLAFFTVEYAPGDSNPKRYFALYELYPEVATQAQTR